MSKKSLFLFLLLNSSFAFSATKPSVSVLSFRNKANDIICNQDWYWWSEHIGSAFKDMVISELSKDENIELLERDNIFAVDEMEVNLINSEKSTQKIEKGHFEKAKYTIVGSVSGYEYCAEKSKVGVSLSKLAGFFGASSDVQSVTDAVSEGVHVSNAKAKIIIDLRLVDTKTGKILKSIKSEGSAERSNFKLSGEIVDYNTAKETPVAEAARDAVSKAVKEIKGKII